LAKLGLDIGFNTRRDSYEVFFESRERKIFSPLTINFPNESQSSFQEASWSEAWLVKEKWRKKKLGDTGWWNQRKLDEEEELIPVSLEGPQMFGWIGRMLLTAKPLSHSREDPARMYSDLVADMYWKISGEISGLSISRIPDDELPDDREAEFEALTFIDHEGRRIHVCHRGADGVVRLLIDGEIVAKIGFTQTATLAEYVIRMSSGRSLDGIKLGR
jgi:hypothetical protein